MNIVEGQVHRISFQPTPKQVDIELDNGVEYTLYNSISDVFLDGRATSLKEVLQHMVMSEDCTYNAKLCLNAKRYDTVTKAEFTTRV
jgi:predicted DNA-binding helix-hairpin-helix protein